MSTGSIAFDLGGEKLSRGIGVAQRGLRIDAEHDREVERVGAVSESFFELAVHA